MLSTVLALCAFALTLVCFAALFVPKGMLKDGLFLAVSLGFLGVWCLETSQHRIPAILFWAAMSGLNTYILLRNRQRRLAR